MDPSNSLTSHGSFISRQAGPGNAAAVPEVDTEGPEGVEEAECVKEGEVVEDMVNRGRKIV